MSWYRKLPVVIEAKQLTHESFNEIWNWAESKPFVDPDGTTSGLSIYTKEGRTKADFGDFVIRGVKGEFYACKPDIFALTYEPAAAPEEWA